MATDIALDIHDSRESWLEARRPCIGGSDAPIICGESAFKTPYQLWAEKCGIDPRDDSESDASRWGLYLEEPIAAEVSRQTGLQIRDPGRFAIAKHPQHEWMICTPDRFIECPERGLVNVQIKTANQYKSGQWSDEPPVAYQIQTQHEMAVLGVEWTILAVLIGGQTFRMYEQRRNDAFVKALIARERQFRKLVESETPPDVDGSEKTAALLAKLFPEDDGESVALPEAADRWDAELQEVKAKIKELTAVEQYYENKFRDSIRSAAIGVLPSGGRYSLKTTKQKPCIIEKPACSYRVLRRMSK